MLFNREEVWSKSNFPMLSFLFNNLQLTLLLCCSISRKTYRCSLECMSVDVRSIWCIHTYHFAHTLLYIYEATSFKLVVSFNVFEFILLILPYIARVVKCTSVIIFYFIRPGQVVSIFLVFTYLIRL